VRGAFLFSTRQKSAQRDARFGALRTFDHQGQDDGLIGIGEHHIVDASGKWQDVPFRRSSGEEVHERPVGMINFPF